MREAELKLMDIDAEHLWVPDTGDEGRILLAIDVDGGLPCELVVRLLLPIWLAPALLYFGACLLPSLPPLMDGNAPFTFLLIHTSSPPPFPATTFLPTTTTQSTSAAWRCPARSFSASCATSACWGTHVSSGGQNESVPKCAMGIRMCERMSSGVMLLTRVLCVSWVTL